MSDVNAEARAEQRQRATIEQLNAEIGARELTPKSLAGELGMDYNTLRRYLTSERRMPIHIMFRILDEFALDPVIFIGRVEDRVQNG